MRSERVGELVHEKVVLSIEAVVDTLIGGMKRTIPVFFLQEHVACGSERHHLELPRLKVVGGNLIGAAWETMPLFQSRMCAHIQSLNGVIPSERPVDSRVGHDRAGDLFPFQVLKRAAAHLFDLSNTILGVSVPLFGVSRVSEQLDVVDIPPVCGADMFQVRGEGIGSDMLELVACLQMKLLPNIVKCFDKLTTAVASEVSGVSLHRSHIDSNENNAVMPKARNRPCVSSVERDALTRSRPAIESSVGLGMLSRSPGVLVETKALGALGDNA